MDRTIYEEEHELFRASARRFLEQEVVPHHDQWERDGLVDKELFLLAGERGLLGMAVPEALGGGGSDDFRFNAVLVEEIAAAHVFSSAVGLTLHNDIVLPYFLRYATDEQQKRWLPSIASGAKPTAVAMTEPGAGSDLSGVRTSARSQGDDYVVNGVKTFITNGIHADLIVTVVRTGTDPHRGLSLLVLETEMDGFTRGRNLEKIGLKAQDTAELFFDDVHVPASNLLGEEGDAFGLLMDNLPQERLSIAISAVAQAQAAFDVTLAYVRERQAFGRAIGTFQNTRFEMAEMHTELELAWTFIDRQLTLHGEGRLTATDAAQSKWWCTEMQKRVVDRCLQLHGGYGYMLEYPIARMYQDARVQTIYGGTTEIMKEIIGRSLDL